jgi:UDP-N-acetyl-D-mannosaminuronic acid dehydrogenase
VNIAFANELSLICDELGLDVWEIISMANHHPRVNILQPGPGVGGHCVAVDPRFIIEAAPQLSRLIRVAREVNERKPVHVAEKIIEKAKRFHDPRVACLGLAFKANVDDVRESPAFEIVCKVATALPDTVVYVVEPHLLEPPERLGTMDNIKFTSSAEAIDNADIVALLVDHDRFHSIKKTRLAGKVVYDTRGLWR